MLTVVFCVAFGLHFYCGCVCCVILSGNPSFRDLAFDILGIFMSPYTLAAQAAQNLGLGQLAVQYTHKTLTRHHMNPVKMYHAHVKLGEMLRSIEE